MTHDEWAEAERRAAQEAAIAAERAHTEAEQATAADPILAWLDAAPVTSSPAVALKVTAALRAVIELHEKSDDENWCTACYEQPPCLTTAAIAEALGIPS